MSLATLAVCTLHGQTSTMQTAPSDPPADEVRFAVAHQHAASWCYGYLYVSQDKIRYEVVQPQSSQNHSFEAPRSQVLARQWVLFGQPQDAIELKIKGATYHMRWLKNEAELNTAGSKRMRPPDSATPDTLIATIQNPGAAAAQGGAQPPNNNLSAGITQASPATFNAGTPAAAPDVPVPGVPASDDNASIPPGGIIHQ